MKKIDARMKYIHTYMYIHTYIYTEGMADSASLHTRRHIEFRNMNSNFHSKSAELILELKQIWVKDRKDRHPT